MRSQTSKIDHEEAQKHKRVTTQGPKQYKPLNIDYLFVLLVLFCGWFNGNEEEQIRH